MIDLKAGIIRIEDSKNGEARIFPYKVLPELARVIAARAYGCGAAGARRDHIPRVPRNGKPIVSFANAWSGACQRARLPHRLVHDLRRGMARAMSRAGVPEAVIMALAGWRLVLAGGLEPPLCGF